MAREQRYRDSAGARLEWEIQLSELDEGELAAIEEFFLANQGAFGSFSFTDPWDGHGVRQLQPGGGRPGVDVGGRDARKHEAHGGAEHRMTMLVYPQLGTGALSQFPVRKTRRTRTVVNRAADGSTIKLADPAAESYGMATDLHGSER